MAARPLPRYRSRHGRCPAGCLRRLHAWLIPKGPARKARVMTKMKCAWRSPPTVIGIPELRVRRKKARKDAWSTMSGRRAIPDIGPESGTSFRSISIRCMGTWFGRLASTQFSLGALMKRALRLFGGLIALCLCLFCGTAAIAAEETIVSRSAEVNGLKLHYLTAGHGPAVILLHGYTQTSRMWRPLIPQLAEKFTVIAPDLPGIGDSDIPKDAVDMKWAAARIHDLAKSLGIKKAEVVGHDIGLMVAYAYAAQFPAETEKLVLMDAFLPGIGEWESTYNDPHIWHFRFNGPTPEALVAGRERIYFEHYSND